LFSSLQTRPISGRVYRGITQVPPFRLQPLLPNQPF
jgi:hypothetical protein